MNSNDKSEKPNGKLGEATSGDADAARHQTASVANPSDDIYSIKVIRGESAFNCIEQPILLQDVNGVCPLLAVVNVLLLRGTKRLLSAESIRKQFVKSKDLIESLSSYICDFSNNLVKNDPSLSVVAVKSMTEGVRASNVLFLYLVLCINYADSIICVNLF